MAEDKILIVEDDNTLREILAYNLSKEGYRILEAADGRQALEMYRKNNPSLILLDILLPVIDGLEVCRIIQSEKPTPIIMLTAKADELDKVLGLEIGADDYLTKPFSQRELTARIKAVLRRSPRVAAARPKEREENPQFLQAGDIKVDVARHSVQRGGEVLKLNPKEFELLTLLMSNPRRVINREEVLLKIWGYEYAGNARTVDVHVRWLRQKLEADPDNPIHLITVRGYGYKFEP